MKCSTCGAVIDTLQCGYCGNTNKPTVNNFEEHYEKDDLEYEIQLLNETINKLKAMQMPPSLRAKKVSLLEQKLNELYSERSKL